MHTQSEAQSNVVIVTPRGKDAAIVQDPRVPLGRDMLENSPAQVTADFP